MTLPFGMVGIKPKVKYRNLYLKKSVEGNGLWKYIGFPDGTYRKMTKEEISSHSLLKEDFDKGGKVFQSISIEPVGKNERRTYEVEFEGKSYAPSSSWKYDERTMGNLIGKNLLIAEGKSLRGKYFHDFYPIQALTIPWNDTNLGNIKNYVVQTAVKVIERCLLMTTDPGDLVFDPTCGSGTTAYVAEQWGRAMDHLRHLTRSPCDRQAAPDDGCFLTTTNSRSPNEA